MANEWWKQPIKKPTPWWEQPKPKQWWETVKAPAKSKSIPPTPGAKYPKTQGGGGGGNTTPQVRGMSTAATTGGGSSYDPYAAERAAASAEAARKKAEDDAKRNKLRGQAGSYLDQLMGLYNELKGLVAKTGADNTSRINKDYDGKIQQQLELMNEGMYTSDANNAAANLAHSSWMAFDRGKIRKAKETNETALNTARSGDLATIGKMVSEDTAKYQADQDGIGRTREMLGQTEDIGELTSTVNNLDASVRGSQAARGKYGTQGEFSQRANALGNYDTSTLEKSLQTIVASTSATPATKQAAMDDLLNGTPLDDNKKKELKNKYTQVV